MAKFLFMLLLAVLAVSRNYASASKGCPPLKAPINGAVVTDNKLAQIYIKSGYYSPQKVALIYVCMNGKWTDPSPVKPAKYPFPDFTTRKQPAGLLGQIQQILQYQGYCESADNEKNLLKSFETYTGTPTHNARVDCYPDTEKPKLISCPANIVKETDHDSIRVAWKDPVYTDNCGKYPFCSLSIQTNIPSGSVFPANNSPVTIRFEAQDPAGNRNEECTFTVTIKKRVTLCPPLKAPINGAVVYDQNKKLAQAYVRHGYYPDGKIAFLYICMNGKWKDPSPITPASIPIPDVISRTPVDNGSLGFVMALWFNGDCNNAAVKQTLLNRFSANTGGQISQHTVFECGKQI